VSGKSDGRRLFARGALDRLGRLAERAQEGAAHALRIGEARFARDDVDRVVAAFDHGAGRLDAQHLDGARRRLARLDAERAAELARAQVGSLGQLIHRQRLAQVALGIAQRLLDAVGLRLQLEQGRELRLAAAAPVVDHQVARDIARHLRAMVRLDHRQAQVDAGRHAGRRPDLAFVDEDPVFFHAQARIRALQVARQLPVGGGALAVQQAGFRQQEGAGADAADAAHVLVGLAQDIEETRRRGLPARLRLPCHQQRIVVVAVDLFGQHIDVERTRDGSPMLGQQRHFVAWFTAQIIGQLEDGRGDEVQCLEAGRQQESDSAFHDVLRLQCMMVIIRQPQRGLQE
jgi:hypothetical protein